MHHPTDRITHTTAFVTTVMEHGLERKIAQWVHPMKDRSDDPPHHLTKWTKGEITLTEIVSAEVKRYWATRHTLNLIHQEMFYLMMHSTHFILQLYGVLIDQCINSYMTTLWDSHWFFKKNVGTFIILKCECHRFGFAKIWGKRESERR